LTAGLSLGLYQARKNAMTEDTIHQAPQVYLRLSQRSVRDE
jgi:hypothetical protein